MKSIKSRSELDTKEEKFAKRLGIRPSELRKRRVMLCDRCKREACAKRGKLEDDIIWVKPDKAESIIPIMSVALCKEYQHGRPEKEHNSR